MRFAYVLLGLVALTKLDISSGICSNGLAGKQSGDYCCAASCDECSTSMCFGPFVPECCTLSIFNKCSATGEAPCVIDDGGFCSNGVPGVEGYDVCCEAQCVTCGGFGCETRPGGEDACCSGSIKGSGEMCSTTNEAPCIIEGVYCSDGVHGVEGYDVCCDAQCGTCGGFGCETRPGGANACCSGSIKRSGQMCSATKEAPCIITDGYCSNGVPGVEGYDVCCEAECVTCGGFGCETRPGGEDACCSGSIKESGEMCSTTMEAPCIIQQGVAES